MAHAETHGCTKGYGVMYNNCFGIKNGNTAPCEKIGKNRMCIYKNKEDSFKAFEKIWITHYKTFPTLHLARRWSGNDHPSSWLYNVTTEYNKLSQI